MMKERSLLSLLALFLCIEFSYADIKWPLYNQQCQDDAGSPFVDDKDIYGPNGFYHDKSAAFPVLREDGSCAKPLQQACQDRPTYKVAYLEGPISCNDNGWYCRIMPDENWPPEALTSDLNFGHCNTTATFDDPGRDSDGHCHGSSVDSTYYWWVRDHFFRRYNGRLRCCCGWYQGTSTTPLFSRRITNRCDYRRLVTESENVDDCRDANEGHGLSYDLGCDSKFKPPQNNKPIPEDDDICWEVQRFGYTEQEYDIPTSTPNVAPSPTKSPSTPKSPSPTSIPTPIKDPTTMPSSNPSSFPTLNAVAICADSLLRLKVLKDGKRISRYCDWVARKSTPSRCALPGVALSCPRTCGKCGDCEDPDVRFKFTYQKDEIVRSCDFIGRIPSKLPNRCVASGNICRKTCGSCS